MESFDTNVVVRVLVEDDPDQCERAALAWRHALAGGGVFLSATVLVEVVWVLHGAFKLDRATIAGALRRLLDSEGVTVEHDLIARAAVDAYEAGPADFADYVILAASRRADALPVMTFDQHFVSDPDVRLVPEKSTAT